MADKTQDKAQAQDTAPVALLGPDERIAPDALASLMRDPIGAHKWALGRETTSKRVRSVARDTLPRFVERTGYTAHDYTEAEADALADAMRGRGRGAPTVASDTIRARATGKVAS